MEALQMLKFGMFCSVWCLHGNIYVVVTGLKKSRLDFMKGWMTEMSEMAGDEPEEDLLARLFGDGAKDAFDTLLQLLGDDDDIVDLV
jgi:hypothetical protein